MYIYFFYLSLSPVYGKVMRNTIMTTNGISLVNKRRKERITVRIRECLEKNKNKKRNDKKWCKKRRMKYS